MQSTALPPERLAINSIVMESHSGELEANDLKSSKVLLRTEKMAQPQKNSPISSCFTSCLKLDFRGELGRLASRLTIASLAASSMAVGSASGRERGCQ